MTDYFIADTHIGHNSVIRFTKDSKYRKKLIKLAAKFNIILKPTMLRPFGTIEEHNMHIIDNINKTVKKTDRLFMLGDIVFGIENFKYLDMIICKNRYLVAGNHDNYATSTYLKYFNKVYGVNQYQSKVILSHVPVHTQQLKHRFKLNVHGHLHSKVLKDKRYVCVSCEQINYTPISYEDILSRL